MTFLGRLFFCGSPLLVVLGMGTQGAEPEAVPFKAAAVPGGVAVIPLSAQGQAPQVRYRGEPVLTRRTPAGWVAVVGLPLSAKPGQDALEVNGHAVPFSIRAKHYPEQRLRLENKRLVNPNPEDEARIAREQALMAPAWKAWPEGWTPSLAFVQPTQGGLTSSFGLRRVFNGEARSPHSGLDIKAPSGQAVHAPAAGVVVLTGDFFFSGARVEKAGPSMHT